MTDLNRPTSSTGPDVLPAWRVEVRALYEDVDREVARLGPVCELSGRCCRFLEYGHTLFISTVEARLLVAEAPPPQRPLDLGETCPWQDALGRCTARDARPLGCRVYHCDPAFFSAAPELSERFISRLKQMSQDHGLSWNYAPLHHHLEEARTQGRLPIELANPDPQGFAGKSEGNEVCSNPNP